MCLAVGFAAVADGADLEGQRFDQSGTHLKAVALIPNRYFGNWCGG